MPAVIVRPAPALEAGKHLRCKGFVVRLHDRPALITTNLVRANSLDPIGARYRPAEGEAFNNRTAGKKIVHGRLPNSAFAIKLAQQMLGNLQLHDLAGTFVNA